MVSIRSKLVFRLMISPRYSCTNALAGIEVSVFNPNPRPCVYENSWKGLLGWIIYPKHFQFLYFLTTLESLIRTSFTHFTMFRITFNEQTSIFHLIILLSCLFTYRFIHPSPTHPSLTISSGSPLLLSSESKDSTSVNSSSSSGFFKHSYFLSRVGTGGAVGGRHEQTARISGLRGFRST